MILIKTNYKGEELVKCANCGEEYPISWHGCPECGLERAIWLREEVEDARSESN